jgi:hypothetical protein
VIWFENDRILFCWMVFVSKKKKIGAKNRRSCLNSSCRLICSAVTSDIADDRTPYLVKQPMKRARYFEKQYSLLFMVSGDKKRVHLSIVNRYAVEEEEEDDDEVEIIERQDHTLHMAHAVSNHRFFFALVFFITFF